MPSNACDPFKGFILQQLDAPQTIGQVLIQLQQEHGFKVSRSTLCRALANWGVLQQPKVKDTAELRARVTTIFYQWQLTDKDTVALLNIDGFQITERGLKTLRKKMGLTKRVQPWQEKELDAVIEDVLRQEYNTGVIEDFGKEHLYTYIKEKYSHYHIIGRYDTRAHLAVGLASIEKIRKNQKKIRKTRKIRRRKRKAQQLVWQLPRGYTR